MQNESTPAALGLSEWLGARRRSKTWAELVRPSDGSMVEFWPHRMSQKHAGIRGWFRGGFFWSTDNADHWAPSEVNTWQCLRNAMQCAARGCDGCLVCAPNVRAKPSPNSARGKTMTDKATENNAPAPLLGLGLSEGLGPLPEDGLHYPPLPSILLRADEHYKREGLAQAVRDYAGACVVAATTECSQHWQKRLDAAVAAERERGAAAVALLKRIRYHAQRHALPRDWLTAADEVLGTWGPVKLDHPELKA